jgi:hypothetical protein
LDFTYQRECTRIAIRAHRSRRVRRSEENSRSWPGQDIEEEKSEVVNMGIASEDQKRIDLSSLSIDGFNRGYRS